MRILNYILCTIQYYFAVLDHWMDNFICIFLICENKTFYFQIQIKFYRHRNFLNILLKSWVSKFKVEKYFEYSSKTVYNFVVFHPVYIKFKNSILGKLKLSSFNRNSHLLYQIHNFIFSSIIKCDADQILKRVGQAKWRL